MYSRPQWRAAIAAFSISLLAAQANAAAVLSGTRIIYPAEQREVTLKLSNEGSGPVLVQSWLDDGDPNATPDQVNVPFTLTPPLFRLDPKKGQTLRIIYTQDPLPQDRESLFWLNALEVPPRASNAPGGANSLQLAVRTRIKLFFRPKGLPGSASEAASQVRWRFVKTPKGDYALAVNNPTPYHITFSKVRVHVRGRDYVNEEGAMVPPNADLQLDIGQIRVIDSEIPTAVRYTTVNDYGVTVDGESGAGSQ